MAEPDPDDLLAIPAFLRRTPSTKKSRKFSSEIEARRRDHKLAMECQRLLAKAKRNKARKARSRKGRRPTTKA